MAYLPLETHERVSSSAPSASHPSLYSFIHSDRKLVENLCQWWGCAAGRWKLDPQRLRGKWNLGPKRSNSVLVLVDDKKYPKKIKFNPQNVKKGGQNCGTSILPNIDGVPSLGFSRPHAHHVLYWPDWNTAYSYSTAKSYSQWFAIIRQAAQSNLRRRQDFSLPSETRLCGLADCCQSRCAKFCWVSTVSAWWHQQVGNSAKKVVGHHSLNLKS